MTKVTVPGRDAGHIMLYALSTCGWCRKTKELLEELSVQYTYEYVDELVGEERAKTIEEVTKFNPKCNFPTLVIDKETCIIGYEEDKIRETLGS